VNSKKGKTIEIADPFARRLVGQYLENRNDDIARLTKALGSADFETIRITGHNLFGSGAAYGFDDISAIGASIESAATDSDVPLVERLIGDLRELLAKITVR
jgi:HPt (histidine-containing phosphotransfer) domain-containing protein